jgi:hypothetical protein
MIPIPVRLRRCSAAGKAATLVIYFSCEARVVCAGYKAPERVPRSINPQRVRLVDEIKTYRGPATGGTEASSQEHCPNHKRTREMTHATIARVAIKLILTVADLHESAI